MAKATFIQEIVAFKTDVIKDSVKNHILASYIKNDKWSIEKITKASNAAGPLA